MKKGIDILKDHIDWKKNGLEEPDIFIAYKKNLDRVKFKIWTTKKNEYVWLTVEEYKDLKKWANENNLIQKYVDEFFATDCNICRGGHIDHECRYYVRSIVGACRGKRTETLIEAINQKPNKFIDTVQKAI